LSKLVAERDAVRFPNHDELLAIGTRLLRAWEGCDADTEIDVLAVAENVSFVVRGASNDKVLRWSRPGYQTATTVRSEMAWRIALRNAGLNVAEPHRTAAGGFVAAVDGLLATLVDWLPGDAVTVDSVPSHAASLSVAQQLGRLSASMQHVGWAAPAWFARMTWDGDALLGPQSTWGSCLDLVELAPAQRSLLIAARDRVRRRLLDDTTPLVLSHSDVRPVNVLVHNGVVSVIDLDDCGYTWPLYDAATYLAEVPGDVEAIADAWLHGYRSVAAVDDALLWDLVIARLLAFLGWLHRHPDHASRADDAANALGRLTALLDR
jgi:Ser/Thr protein kinase RdoA (MazF antagonist)